MNYKSKAASAITVKVVTFYDLPDYILSIDEWNEVGGWRGVIKHHLGTFRDVKKVIDGKMSLSDFNKLQLWEG